MYSRAIPRTQSSVSTDIPFVRPTSPLCYVANNSLTFSGGDSVSEVANPGGMRILATTVADIVMSNYLRAACSFLR